MIEVCILALSATEQFHTSACRDDAHAAQTVVLTLYVARELEVFTYLFFGCGRGALIFI